MSNVHRIARSLMVVIAAHMGLGCVEAKIGVGPFKAISVEAGPGRVEAKGPSAGPLTLKGKAREADADKDE